MNSPDIEKAVVSKLVRNIAFNTLKLDKILILNDDLKTKVDLNKGIYAVLKSKDGSIIIAPINGGEVAED